jgi:type II secretory ATPase GspE/PulE/Tfp pilus assembly ATPase PilB-like protein
MKKALELDYLGTLEDQLLLEFGAPLDLTTSSGYIMAVKLATHPAVGQGADRLLREQFGVASARGLRFQPQADGTYAMRVPLAPREQSATLPALVAEALTAYWLWQAGLSPALLSAASGRLRKRPGLAADLRLELEPQEGRRGIWISQPAPSESIVSLEQLGVRASDAAALMAAVTHPGLVVVAGDPTARRRLLVAMATLLATPMRHIAYASDFPPTLPDEVSRIPLDEETILPILRSLGRIDADQIIIDLPQLDPVALELLMNQAMTGLHMVVGLPARSVAQAVRQWNADIRPHQLATGLAAAATVTSLPRLCRGCRRSVSITKKRLAAAHPTFVVGSRAMFYQADGCEHCDGGVTGENLVLEMVELSPVVRHQIAAARRASGLQAVLDEAVAEPDRLAAQALQLAKTGRLSFAEFERFCAQTDLDGLRPA